MSLRSQLELIAINTSFLHKILSLTPDLITSRYPFLPPSRSLCSLPLPSMPPKNSKVSSTSNHPGTRKFLELVASLAEPPALQSAVVALQQANPDIATVYLVDPLDHGNLSGASVPLPPNPQALSTVSRSATVPRTVPLTFHLRNPTHNYITTASTKHPLSPQSSPDCPRKVCSIPHIKAEP